MGRRKRSESVGSTASAGVASTASEGNSSAYEDDENEDVHGGGTVVSKTGRGHRRSHKKAKRQAKPNTSKHTKAYDARTLGRELLWKAWTARCEAAAKPTNPGPGAHGGHGHGHGGTRGGGRALHVHRLRHLKVCARAVTAMASDPERGTLAVGRWGGTVEVWDPSQKWRRLSIVPGLRGRSVDSLVAASCVLGARRVHHNRNNDDDDDVGGFFGASASDGTVFRVDDDSCGHRDVVGSGGGAVYALVAVETRFVGVGDSDDGYDNNNNIGNDNDKDTPKKKKKKKRGLKKGKCLAAGCEDGTVRFFDPSSSLMVLGSTATAGAPITALASCQGQGNGAVVYAAVADGTLRRYECSRGAGGKFVVEPAEPRMTLETRGLSVPTVVWALTVIEDYDYDDMGNHNHQHNRPSHILVSGNSLGQVQFWDGVRGLLLQTLDHNDQSAPVLTLCAVTMPCDSDSQGKGKGNRNDSHPQGGRDLVQRVFASGVDSRVVCFERTTRAPPPKSSMSHTKPRGILKRRRSSYGSSTSTSSSWYISHAQRPHTHDVSSLVIVGPTKAAMGGEGQRLCSGGVDTVLCTYSLKGSRSFRAERPVRIHSSPDTSGGGLIHVASRGRLLGVLRSDRGVDLYRLKSRPSSSSSLTNHDNDNDNSNNSHNEERMVVGGVSIDSAQNLCCMALSEDGHYMAVSDASNLMLFRIVDADAQPNGEGDVKVEPVVLPAEARRPCTALTFATEPLGSSTDASASTSSPPSWLLVGATAPHVGGRGIQVLRITKERGGAGDSTLASPSVTVVTSKGDDLFTRRDGDGYGYVHRMVSNGRYVACLRLPRSTVDVYDLKTGLHARDVLPPWSKCDGPPCALAITPTIKSKLRIVPPSHPVSDSDSTKDKSCPSLVVATLHNAFLIYHLWLGEGDSDNDNDNENNNDNNNDKIKIAAQLSKTMLQTVDWSYDAGIPAVKAFPPELSCLKRPTEYPVRIAMLPPRRQTNVTTGTLPLGERSSSSTTTTESTTLRYDPCFLMGGYGYYCSVDLDHPIPDHAMLVPNNHVRAVGLRKDRIRKELERSKAKGAHRTKSSTLTTTTSSTALTTKGGAVGVGFPNNFMIGFRYNPMLYMDFLSTPAPKDSDNPKAEGHDDDDDDYELVVVEQPWSDVLEDLPDPLYRKVFAS